MTIAIRSLFEEDCKLYPQVFLDEKTKELIYQNGLMLLKQIYQNNVIFAIIGILRYWF